MRVVPGGTAAGKTYGIIPILISLAAKIPNLEISIVSETIPHLRKGALKDFLKIMKETGRYLDERYNRTLLTYTFHNGSYIEFFSADQEGKVRGPRRNILYINECNNLSFDTYHQLAIRTSMQIWLDFNPSHEFWAHQELETDEDAEWLTLTYQDNEALDESIKREIEKAKDKAYHNPNLPEGTAKGFLDYKANIKNPYWWNWWKVYGLGMTGSLEGIIFTNWKSLKEIPEEATLTGGGLDFGYTNDPTAIIARYYWNGKAIYHELCYETKLKNPEIAEILKMHFPHNMTVWADSAEPKSIDEIKDHHINIKPVEKGADSINYGIQIMQEEDFYVTESSINLIKELRRYTWDTDKDDKTINKPIDNWNHAIDAARYCEMMTRRKPNRPSQSKAHGNSKVKLNRM